MTPILSLNASETPLWPKNGHIMDRVRDGQLVSVCDCVRDAEGSDIRMTIAEVAPAIAIGVYRSWFDSRNVSYCLSKPSAL